MSSDPLSAWVARFRTRFHDVRFRIDERDDAAEVVELVRSGACEIGFLSTSIAAELVHEELVDQRFVLVCPPGTESFWPAPTPIAALSGVPLVMSGKGTAIRDYIEQSLRASGVEPRVVVEVPQRGAVLSTVLSGGGAAIMPLRIALDARHRGGVVRELTPALSRPIGVVHRGAQMTAAANEFLNYAKHSLQGWLRNIESYIARGESMIEAASLATQDEDNRIRERNRHNTDVRPNP